MNAFKVISIDMDNKKSESNTFIPVLGYKVLLFCTLLFVLFHFYYVNRLFLKTVIDSRNRCGSVDRVSACRLKGPGFDSGQGHVPWLRAHPPVGGVQEAADR